MNSGIYASHLTAAIIGFVGALVGGWVAYSVLRGKYARPVVTWLLVVMFVLCADSALEQIRSLGLRLIVDGIAEPWVYESLESTKRVSSLGRIIASGALGAGVMLQLALYYDQPSKELNKWVIAGALTSPAIWLIIRIIGELL